MLQKFVTNTHTHKKRRKTRNDRRERRKMLSLTLIYKVYVRKNVVHRFEGMFFVMHPSAILPPPVHANSQYVCLCTVKDATTVTFVDNGSSTLKSFSI